MQSIESRVCGVLRPTPVPLGEERRAVENFARRHPRRGSSHREERRRAERSFGGSWPGESRAKGKKQESAYGPGMGRISSMRGGRELPENGKGEVMSNRADSRSSPASRPVAASN